MAPSSNLILRILAHLMSSACSFFIFQAHNFLAAPRSCFPFHSNESFIQNKKEKTGRKKWVQQSRVDVNIFRGPTQSDHSRSTLTITSTDNLQLPVYLTYMSLECGGSWNTQTEPAEHANSAQKDLSQN